MATTRFNHGRSELDRSAYRTAHARSKSEVLLSFNTITGFDSCCDAGGCLAGEPPSTRYTLDSSRNGLSDALVLGIDIWTKSRSHR